jgi:Lrp/AsnC family transcriptional regulator, regulator for asnA, asnC and gidA
VVPLDFVDEIDRQIIRCMQDDPRASYASIARQVDVSETTVRRRVATLTETKMIKLAILPDTIPLGYTVQAYVGLKTEPRSTNEIAAALSDISDVMLVALVHGRWDILIYCAAPTIEVLNRFLSEHVAPMPGVREMEVLHAATFMKMFSEWRLPLD